MLIEYYKWFYDEEQENGVKVRIYEDIIFPNHDNTKASDVTITYLKDIK